MHRNLAVPAILIPLLSIALAAAPAARAATTPPGVNIRWDKCYDDGGALNKVFACDTNSGSERIVCSLVLGQPAVNVTGCEIYVDMASQSITIPAWWQMRNAGTCRQSALSFLLTPPAGSANCLDWASGQSAGGGAYLVGFHSPNTVRIVSVAAVPTNALASLSSGQEYFVCTFEILHAKTVGAGSCGGCDVPMCIFLSRMKLTFANNDPLFVLLEQGANGLTSQYVTWQDGVPINIQRQCDTPVESCISHYISFDCVASITPIRSSRWGAVKALYR
jgi:hypothetical protein